MGLQAPSGAAPAGLALKAWVQFVGATGAIIKSANIASVVRNGVGEYAVTFTNAMASVNYVVVDRIMVKSPAGAITRQVFLNNPAAASCTLRTFAQEHNASTLVDSLHAHFEFYE